jgi:hypothetical protein
MKKTFTTLSLLLTILLLQNEQAFAQRRSAAKNAKKSSSKSSSSSSKRSSGSKKSSSAKGADSDKKLFSNIFWGAFINGGVLPGSLLYQDVNYGTDINGNEIIGKSVNDLHSIGGFIAIPFIGYNGRYILKELNNEASIGLDASPSLGLTLTPNGIGTLEVPILLSYNSGAASTYSSKKDNGIGIGVGVHLIKNGIIKSSIFDGGVSTNQKTIDRSFFIQPAATITYRYFNSNENAREWSLKLGYSSYSGVYDPEGRLGQLETNTVANSKRNPTESDILKSGYSNTAFMIRLSVGYYLGY